MGHACGMYGCPSSKSLPYRTFPAGVNGPSTLRLPRRHLQQLRLRDAKILKRRVRVHHLLFAAKMRAARCGACSVRWQRSQAAVGEGKHAWQILSDLPSDHGQVPCHNTMPQYYARQPWPNTVARDHHP
eukprot:357658-Chlamydomonas_euryale.AAC.3